MKRSRRAVEIKKKPKQKFLQEKKLEQFDEKKKMIFFYRDECLHSLISSPHPRGATQLFSVT